MDDADRALPGAEVRVGAERHVLEERVAPDLEQVFESVGIEAVVGDARAVEVERARPGLPALWKVTEPPRT